MAATDSDKTSFEDFRRYYHDEMSHEEQHRWEKRLLDEPLLADAYEGYVAMVENEIDRDGSLAELNKALLNRINGEKKRIIPIWAYAAAASVMVSVSWLAYTTSQQKRVTNIAGDQMKAPAPVIEDFAATVSPSSVDSLKKEQLAQVRTEKSPAISRFEEKADRIASVEQSGSVVVASDHLLTETSPANPSREVDAARSLSAPSPALSSPSLSRSRGAVIEESGINSTMVAHGRIVDANGQGIPGVNVFKLPNKTAITDSSGQFNINIMLPDSLKLAYVGYKPKWIVADKLNLGDIKLEDDFQALSEVVVVGYGTQKKSVLVGANYTKASPVGGWKAYEIYLRQKSADSRTGSVKVSFQVNINGSLSGFSAKGDRGLRTPAINLVKNGPSWVPASKNNTKSAEKVTVTVVFLN